MRTNINISNEAVGEDYDIVVEGQKDEVISAVVALVAQIYIRIEVEARPGFLEFLSNVLTDIDVPSEVEESSDSSDSN